MLSLQRYTLAWLTFLAACGQSAGPSDEELPPDSDFPIAILTLTPQVIPGSALQIEIQNNSTITIGYNLCTDGALERWTALGWVALPRMPYPCPLPLYGIDPGRSTALPFSIPSDAPRGTYRLRIRFVSILGTQSMVRRSNSFSVF